MSKKDDKKKGRKLFKYIPKETKNNERKEDDKELLLSKTNKEIATYKKLQNIDLSFYDSIFSNFQFGNIIIEDFTSFKVLLQDIKKQFKSDLLYNQNISSIQKEGKFCFDKYNLAKIVPFCGKILNLEISINNKYIKTKDISIKYRQFFINSSIFKGKHCFEIDIINLLDNKILFGLLDINKIEDFNKELFNLTSEDLIKSNIRLIHNLVCFNLETSISIKKSSNNIYNHYLKYGDIIGFGFDLDNRLLYLYLNGEIVNTYILNVEIGENISFIPVISINELSEIIINLDEKLKYLKNYKEKGFIPFNEIGKNNYEISGLKKVTDDYINILINNEKSIIKNNNLTFSDINEIYHDIFDFLGNISFQHSFIIQNSFIKNIEINYENDEDLEFYYIFLRYTLNSVKEQKSLLKNIILNLIESIHIYLIKGNLAFKKLYNLFIFLLSKNDFVYIISEFDSHTIKYIFSQICISFHPNEVLFNKFNFDFIIKTNQNLENNNDFILKDLIKDSRLFTLYIKEIKLFYDKQNICKIFSKLVETILKNGIESAENENMWNNIIIKNLNDFIISELNSLSKANISINKKIARFNDIFKSFFIPGMLLFNNLYEDYKKSSNNYLVINPILKYLIKNKGEKLGGIEKYINIPINNYNEFINMKMESVSSIFLLEFIELFFLNNNAKNLWHSLFNTFSVLEGFKKENFISSIKKSSHDEIHSKFLSFLEYQLNFPSLEEIEIYIHFLINFANILLNDLYPSKLIYFLPAKIIMLLPKLITFLTCIIVNLFRDLQYILDYSNSYQKEKKTYFNDIFVLANNCLQQIISVFIKIISDECVKIIPVKCAILKFFKRLLISGIVLSDEQFFCLFNFINNEIHKDEEYQDEVLNFIEIFNEKLKTSETSFTRLGKNLYELFNKKENNNILRIILNLLYNNINDSLSDLEENLSEFKPTFKNNNNNINKNNLNNSNLDINNVNSNNENNNISQIGEKEKLEELNFSLIDINWQFIKLNNFYSLASDIIGLYDFGSFENNFLNNLLLSIYSIIFFSDNLKKIQDNKLDSSYKKLINTILKFYTIIFKNISILNKENIMKELSRRRNIYHLKDIGKFFNIINELKKDKISNDKLIYFNSFLISLEAIIPEKDVIKLINNNNDDKSFENNNLCPICFDSVVDTHLLPCEHLICRNCYLQYISMKKLCPFCRIKIEGTKENKNL